MQRPSNTLEPSEPSPPPPPPPPQEQQQPEDDRCPVCWEELTDKTIVRSCMHLTFPMHCFDSASLDLTTAFVASYSCFPHTKPRQLFPCRRHRYHRGCTVDYAEHCVRDHNPIPIPCFVPGCDAHLADAQVRRSFFFGLLNRSINGLINEWMD